MISELGHAIEELGKIIQQKGKPDPDMLMNKLARIQELELPFYDSFDFSELVKNQEALAKIAATNMMATPEHKGVSVLSMLIKLYPILQDETALILMAYCMKQAIILYQAEQKAKQLASEGLARWVVATEPEPELNPNPDQPVQPHDGLPESS